MAKWLFGAPARCNGAVSEMCSVCGMSDSLPILSITGSFALKQRIRAALKEPRANLNACRKRLLGLYRAGGLLELTF